MERDHCIRCGECCRSGGPALHLSDLDLIANRIISASEMITYRTGEYVRDQPSGRLARLETEIVKVRGRGGGRVCLHFDEQAAACAIYENRPAECRALKCWDTTGLEAMYEKERVTRADILGPGAMEIVAEHERRCPAGRALDLALMGGGLELDEMLSYDSAVRETLIDRGAEPVELDFLLGRSLNSLIEAARAARPR